MKKFGIKRATDLRNVNEFSKEEISELKSITFSEHSTQNNNDSNKNNATSENQKEPNNKEEKDG